MQCTATRADGEQCQSSAVHGGELCSTHRDGEKRSKLTPELIEQLVSLIRAGNYVAVACRAAGISRQLFYSWVERGASDAPEDATYHELRERIEHARAEAEARNVTLIAQAARDNWQAAAWWLERQYPERWAKPSVRTRDEVADSETTTTEIDDVFAEVDELAAARRKRGA